MNVRAIKLARRQPDGSYISAYGYPLERFFNPETEDWDEDEHSHGIELGEQLVYNDIPIDKIQEWLDNGAEPEYSGFATFPDIDTARRQHWFDKDMSYKERLDHMRALPKQEDNKTYPYEDVWVEVEGEPWSEDWHEYNKDFDPGDAQLFSQRILRERPDLNEEFAREPTEEEYVRWHKIWDETKARQKARAAANEPYVERDWDEEYRKDRERVKNFLMNRETSDAMGMAGIK